METKPYILRVTVEGKGSYDAPFPPEQGAQLALLVPQIEQNPALAQMFDALLAQVWEEYSKKALAEGRITEIPDLEKYPLSFELITPD
jgi:hypothetical protein